MTPITRTVKRETAVHYRNRPLIVELHPAHLTLREKGRRFPLDIGYAAVLELAYKLLARERAATKAALRKLRRSR